SSHGFCSAGPTVRRSRPRSTPRALQLARLPLPSHPHPRPRLPPPPSRSLNPPRPRRPIGRPPRAEGSRTCSSREPRAQTSVIKPVTQSADARLVRGTAELSFPPRKGFVTVAADFAKAFCSEHTDDSEALARIQLAAHELAENVVKYSAGEV